MTRNQVTAACKRITKSTGLPATDVLWLGARAIVTALLPYLKRQRRERIAGRRDAVQGKGRGRSIRKAAGDGRAAKPPA